MKINISIALLACVLFCSAQEIDSLKAKDAIGVKQEWKADKISIIASLDQKKYRNDEKIDLSVGIYNNSDSNVVIYLVNEFRDLKLQGKNKKTNKFLPMTERYETVVKNRAYTTSRRIMKTICPGKSYTYQAMDLRNYFKFDSEGSFSLSISGAFYQVKLEKIIHFSIDNIDFEIIDKNKRE